MEKTYKSKRYQIILIFICWLIYSIAQLGRYSYSSNINLIMTKYSVNHTDASLPSTLFFLFYGIGQVLNGILCNRYNRRIVLTVALFGSAVINGLIYFNIEFVYIKYLWALNGLLQSSLWVLLMQTISVEIDRKLLEFAALMMSMSPTIGTFLIYGLSAIITSIGQFEFSFLLSAVLLIFAAAVWFTFSFTFKKSGMTAEEISEKETSDIPKKFALLLILFIFFSIVAYAISGGLKSWSPAILKETFELNDWVSIFLSVLLPLFSIFNSIVAGRLYKLFKNFILVSIFGFFATSIILIPTIFLFNFSWILTLILLILICISSGVVTNAMTVQAPLFLKNKKFNAGFLAGILNGSCYFGNAISTLTLGVIADNSEWNKIFVFFLILSIVSLIIGSIYYRYTKRSK